RAEAGRERDQGGAARVHRSAVRQVVAPRTGGVRLGDPEDERGEVRQEGAADAVPFVTAEAAGGGGSAPAGSVASPDRGASGRAAWAIPDEILARAPESPWGFPVDPFRARAERSADGAAASVSARRALEALPEGGSVLDVGSGAGAASLALVPR